MAMEMDDVQIDSNRVIVRTSKDKLQLKQADDFEGIVPSQKNRSTKSKKNENLGVIIG
jgi:hypothetical protein